MHLIDEVNLVAATAGRILHIFQQLAGIFYLGARCRIHFDQINKTPLVDLATGTAFATGGGTHALLTIDRFGQNAGYTGLTHPTGAGKQKGMV